MSKTGPSKSVVALVIDREQGHCARCGDPITGERGMGWSIHHRVPRGAGGAKHVPWINLPANLLLVCGSGTTGCHGWIEGHRAESIKAGWLMLRNSYLLPEDIPVVHSLYGRAFLNDKGSAVPSAFVAEWESIGEDDD